MRDRVTLEMVLCARNPIFSNLSYSAVSPMLQERTLFSPPSAADATQRRQPPSGNPSDPRCIPALCSPPAAARAARSRRQSASQHMSPGTLRGTRPQITPTPRGAPGTSPRSTRRCRQRRPEETKTSPRLNVNLPTPRCARLRLYRNSQ